jgi:outer membrane protein TolC
MPAVGGSGMGLFPLPLWGVGQGGGVFIELFFYFCMRNYFPFMRMIFCRLLLILLFLFFCLPSRSQEHTLSYFIREGIKNSPLLRDINGQIKENQIDSLVIKAMNKPRVEFKGYAYYAPVINDFGYSTVLTNLANLTSVMSVSQPFLNKKTIEANLSKNEIKKQALTNTVLLTENSLKKAITAAYLDAYSTWSEISVNLELLSFAKEQEKILRSLTENGIYKQTDYLAFTIDQQEQELQVGELKVLFQKQISDLYILCGIRDTAVFLPVKPDLENQSVQVKASSPMFMRFLIDSLRINNENLLIDRNYKPVLNWFSDAGLINNDPSVIYQNFGVSLGLSLTLPVYDGNQRKLNRQKLRSEEDIRSGYARAFKREYDQQLQQLMDELEQTRALLPSVRSQVHNTELLMSQVKELVSRGSGSITDYLIAIRNYISARKNLNQNEVRILQIQNEINYWK